MASIASAQPMTSAVHLALTDLYRINVCEYDRIVAAGALDDERLELIDGYMVKKMPKNPPHTWSTKVLVKALERLLIPGWTWRIEQPVRIPQYNEPEPDIAIVRGSDDDDYKHRTPGPTDVALLVEVSESTLDRDQGEKLLAYAKGNIPVYWIVNLVDGQVEIYTGPGTGGYRSRQVFNPGEAIAVVIDGHEVGRIAVADILP
jgi:Uma2 family endonuclease